MIKKDIIIEGDNIVKRNKKTKRSKLKWKDFIPSMIYWPIIITQSILVFLYYNYYNLSFLSWIGWGSLGFFLIFGALPKQAFNKYGEIEKGKSHIYTTKLVDKGVYAIIRHPYWLCWIILSISLSFLSQYWIMIILTITASSIIYLETFNLDRGLIDKFGTDYKDYIKRVPRMNIIYGLILFLRTKFSEIME